MNEDDDPDEEEAPDEETKSHRSIRKRRLVRGHGDGTPAKPKGEIVLSKKFSPRFLDHADSRLAVVKLMKRRYQALSDDADGQASTQRALLCKRASFLSIVLETLETQMLEEGKFDLAQYGQASNTLTGILKALGLERRIRKVGGLAVYMAEKEKDQ